MANSGFPVIKLIGDRKRCEELVRYARAEMFRTEVLTNRLGVGTFKRVVELDENTVFILQTVRNNNSIITIIADKIIQEEKLEEKLEEKIKEEEHLSIYSGFTFGAKINTIEEVEYLQTFNPTADCVKNNGGDFDVDLTYQAVTRLAVEKSPISTSEAEFGSLGSGTASQYHNIRACQYTGLMAKAVSGILGYGNFNLPPAKLITLLLKGASDEYKTNVTEKGFQVLYDYRYIRCHSIVKAEDGTFWLVECSQTNGIIAEPLKYLPKDLFSADKTKDFATGSLIEIFGALPMGNVFSSSRSVIQTAISEGQIIELMEPEDYVAKVLGDWEPFSDTMCWAFNTDGTEARTTAYKMSKVDGTVTGVNAQDVFTFVGYFKLEITINGINTGRVTSSSPIGSGTATITTIEEGVIVASGLLNEYDNLETFPTAIALGNNSNDTLVSFHHISNNAINSHSIGIATFNPQTWFDNLDDIPDIMDKCIWVGYLNDQWEEVRLIQQKLSQPETQYSFNELGMRAATPTQVKNGGKVYWNWNNLVLVKWSHLKCTSMNYRGQEWYWETYKEHSWRLLYNFNYEGTSGEYPLDYTRGWQRADGFTTYADSLHNLNRPPHRVRATIPGHNRSAYYYYEDYWDHEPPNWYSTNVHGLIVTTPTCYGLYVQDAHYSYDTTLEGRGPQTYSYPTDYRGLPPLPPGAGGWTVFGTHTEVAGQVITYPGNLPTDINEDNWPTCSVIVDQDPNHITKDMAVIDGTVFYSVDYNHVGFDFPYTPEQPGGGPASVAYKGLISEDISRAQCENMLSPYMASANVVFPLPSYEISNVTSKFFPRFISENDVNTIWQSSYWSEGFIVCDRLVEITKKPYYKFLETTDESFVTKIVNSDQFCQHAVIGEPAMVYSNPYSPHSDYGKFNLETLGVHPKLPATDDTQDYKALTFVGVNGKGLK